MRRAYSNAKKRVLGGHESQHIPKEEFLKLWVSNTCAICGGNLADVDKSVDHIIPLSKGGTNDIGNMQMAHLRCNQKKRDLLDYELAS